MPGQRRGTTTIGGQFARLRVLSLFVHRMFSKPAKHQFRLWPGILIGAWLLCVSGTSSSKEAEEPATAEDRAIAKGFIRCETFYKHYYESLRHSNPKALQIPAIAKLPIAIRVQRIAAESLIGEKEANALYGENLESQLLEFTAAATGDKWSSYAKQMSAECSRLASENDNDRINGKVQRYMDMKGIKNPLQTEQE